MSATCLKSVRFLAVLGAMALIVTGECQAVFIGVFVSFFLLGLKVEKLPTLARFFGVAQPFLAAFIFVVALVDFFFLSKSFLLTVAHFLLSVQGVRLLALRTTRENFGSLLLSSLMMLSASTLSVEWTFFAMLFIFLMGVIWTLMLLTLLDENQLGEANVGGLQEGSLLWNQLMPILRGSSAVAFSVAAVCCTLVFIFFPRFNFRGFRGEFLQPVHKTGFSSQVDLSRGSRVVEDNSIVMRVEINPKDKPMWTGYLRGRALENFDGKVWEKFPTAPKNLFRPGGRPFVLPNAEANSKRLFHQKIYLESMDSSLLFAQSRLVALDMDRPFLEVGEEGSLQRRMGDSWRVRYEVESSLSALDPVVGRELASNDSLIPVGLPKKKTPMDSNQSDLAHRKSLEEARLFVPDYLKGKLKEFSGNLLKETNSPFQKAQLLELHLQSNFNYSLDSRLAANSTLSPFESFLYESKKGHCEYFAAGLCLMLRSQGVPARMVTGFLSREWNSRGHYFIVRMKHAHAWVEAYIEPHGWVGFDPSPRTVFDGSGDGGVHRWSEMMDTLNLRWNRYILSYDFERQVEIVKAISQQSGSISFRLGRLGAFPEQLKSWISSLRRGTLPEGKKEPASFTTEGLMGLFVFGLIVVGAMGVMWRRAVRHKDRVWFYKPLLRRLEKKGGRKPAAQTLREFILLSQPKLGDVFEDAFLLQQTYYQLRFDPTFHLSAEQSAQIREKLKQL